MIDAWIKSLQRMDAHPSPSATEQLLLTLFLIEAARGWEKNCHFTATELGIKKKTEKI